MRDIVERLRDSASNPAIWKLTQEAADEIERLRAELAAAQALLREALLYMDNGELETKISAALSDDQAPSDTSEKP